MGDRRGSALLIVLGFLSFMVVSAVAFSIYMRSERMPSSVFRRKAVSRQLVHAAVARAISDLDNALRADPYPGIHSGNTSQMKNKGGRFLDEWHGRVFMPPNPGTFACPDHTSRNQLSRDGAYRENTCLMAPLSETAAVLNLEALGYVPAPLFNDVRFLSRLTWSAKWRPFDHGAGRYAYVAVNVSDYLDVNRLKDVADAFRSSSSRINLVSLFSGGNYNNSAIDSAGNFRDHNRSGTVNGGRSASSEWPFVSLLDFYLDMQGGYADCKSPFYEWIGTGQSGAGYDGIDKDKIRTQCFVTDSWYPPSPAEAVAGSAIIDLNKHEPEYGSSDSDYGQPFVLDYVRKDNRKSLRDCAQGSAMNTPFFRRFAAGDLPSGSPLTGGQNKSLTFVDAALLKDYLDRDDTPTSLALPCLERVPMVAAMGLSMLPVQLSLVGTTRKTDPETSAGGGTKTTEFTEYKLNPSAFGNNNILTAAIVFPFKRAKEINQTFKARALVRVFLVEETASGLRIDSPLAALRPSDDADWNESASGSFSLRGFKSDVPPVVFTLVSREVTVNTAKDIRRQEDVAIGSDNGRSVNFRFDRPNGFDGQIVFTKKVETITPAKTEADPNPQGKPQPPEYCINASPFNADGTLVEKAKDRWLKEDAFTAEFGSKRFTLQAAAWIMIENDNGDVVDFVPAIADDDNLYNNVSVDLVRQNGYDGSANGTPVFRFRGPSQAAYDLNNADSPLTLVSGDWTPSSYCAVDPRFNYAPEDWLPLNTAMTGDMWVRWVTGIQAANGTDQLLAADGRDSDVFMFVSNQGLLQSMGEFAFISRVTDFGNQAVRGSSTPVDLLRQDNGNMNGTEHRDSDSWNVIAHAGLVWRTYRPYESAGLASDRLLNFRNFGSYGGDTISSKAIRDIGDRGVRVNPYTDSEAILMSAFAFTPYDWWAAAGTNTLGVGVLEDSSNPKDKASARRSMFGDDLDPQYTFSSGSTEARISDDRLKNVAHVIQNTIRADKNGDWQNIYDNNLDWYGDVDPDDENSFRKFLGVDVDEPLHGVDRKFLYSYWRGCLANRQQLLSLCVRSPVRSEAAERARFRRSREDAEWRSSGAIRRHLCIQEKMPIRRVL